MAGFRLWNAAKTFFTQLDMGAEPTENKTFTLPSTAGKLIADTELSYDNDTTSFIANTLASGAIIERGSNANGSYVKWADGTMICIATPATIYTNSTIAGSIYYVLATLTFPATFVSPPTLAANAFKVGGTGVTWAGGNTGTTTTGTGIWSLGSNSGSQTNIHYIAIGRWK